MTPELLQCPYCGFEAHMMHNSKIGWKAGCKAICIVMTHWWETEAEAAAAWNRRAGSWQPVVHDDPYNDGPVWVDENGCVCWAGANGEVRRLVLHGDMRLCLWVDARLEPL
jgi:hypothetical protein